MVISLWHMLQPGECLYCLATSPPFSTPVTPSHQSLIWRVLPTSSKLASMLTRINHPFVWGVLMMLVGRKLNRF